MYSVAYSIVSHGNIEECSQLISNIIDKSKFIEFIIILRSNFYELIPHNFPFNHVIYFINDEVKGFGENHNQNFQYAKDYDYFIILNPDVKLVQDWCFTNLLLESKKLKLEIFTPRLTDSSETFSQFNNIRSFRSLFFPFRFYNKLSDFNNSIFINNNFWISGAFICFTTSSYDRLRGFNENYFLYCEDVDLSLRAHECGIVCGILPDFYAVHSGRKGSHIHLKLFLMHVISLFKLHMSPIFLRSIFNSANE